MAEQTYIVVSGNGETSRNNVEALIGDYVMMLRQEKKSPVIVLVGQGRFTLPQTWCSQYAKELGIDCIAIANINRAAESLTHSSFVLAEDSFDEVAKLVQCSEAYGFLVWEDGDEDSALTLEALSKVGVKCFDLTNGLYDIAPSGEAKAVEAPTAPVQTEVVTVTPPEAFMPSKDREATIRRLTNEFVEALIKALDA